MRTLGIGSRVIEIRADAGRAVVSLARESVSTLFFSPFLFVVRREALEWQLP